MTNEHGTLVVAPYVGEFGWELMNWQGRVRWVIRHGDFDRVIVCAETDRRPLYAMPELSDRVVFCSIGRMELPGRRNEDHLIGEDGQPIEPDIIRGIVESKTREACASLGVEWEEAELMMPRCDSSLWGTSRREQIFADMRIHVPILNDIVLVPRHRRQAPGRNRPDAWWEELTGQLRGLGLAVAVYPDHLGDAIRMLSGARLAVGASTGGLHLASLCRCPHYVWGAGGDAKWTRLGMTNRQRYETVWNPLGTPCIYDECGWQPPMSHVVEGIRSALDDIGRPRGIDRISSSFKPRWRVKRRLARLLEPSDGRQWVPWRMREFVREHIV
jgi:hypothetical protein